MKLSDLLADYAPQSSPFATHVNLLRAVGQDVRTVLELGAGEFSTPLFLDRKWYPKLERLATLESDMAWACACQTRDDRHDLIMASEPMERILRDDLDIQEFDLVLVDNSSIGEMRCSMLEFVATHSRRGQLVIAHDWQVPSYREAGKGFTHQFIDDRQEPWTALLWK